MKIDMLHHEKMLRAITHDDALIRYALARMEAGASKYPQDVDDSASRNFLDEGYEEIVDGLNRIVMEITLIRMQPTPLMANVIESLLNSIQGLDLLRTRRL